MSLSTLMQQQRQRLGLVWWRLLEMPHTATDCIDFPTTTIWIVDQTTKGKSRSTAALSFLIQIVRLEKVTRANPSPFSLPPSASFPFVKKIKKSSRNLSTSSSSSSGSVLTLLSLFPALAPHISSFFSYSFLLRHDRAQCIWQIYFY